MHGEVVAGLLGVMGLHHRRALEVRLLDVAVDRGSGGGDETRGTGRVGLVGGDGRPGTGAGAEHRPAEERQ